MKNKEQMKCALGVCTPKKIKISKNLELEICKICGKILEKDEDVRYWVAVNKNTPIEILEELSKDENEDVRSSVAENPNTPIEILKVLSKDKSETVRYGAAQNFNTPTEILKQLSKDKNGNIRYVAMKMLEV